MVAQDPLNGLKVVEVAAGLSYVGTGMAGSLPGALLRDLGADVVRVQTENRFTLDEGVEFARGWGRGKDVVTLDGSDAGRWTRTITELAGDADVVFLTGSQKLIEGRGVGHRQLTTANTRLVAVRTRSGTDRTGTLPEVELLLHARTGVLTQYRAHRPG